MKSCPQVISVMAPFPHAVDIAASVRTAREFMREHQVRHLPVTENHELTGLITDRDIKRAFGPDFDYPNENELTVRDIYVADPYIVDVSCPLDEVLMVMAERHIGSTLVTKHGKLSGIVTSTDIFRAFAIFLHNRFAAPEDNDCA